jgi:proteasome alpha subunit
VTDEHEFVAIGGHAEDLMDLLRNRFTAGWDLATAVRTAVEVLGSPEGRTIEADAIETGVLDRTRAQRRKFRRLEKTEIVQLLAG